MQWCCGRFPLVLILCLTAGLSGRGIEIHVAPGGDDGGEGTSENPLGSLEAAQSEVRKRVTAGLADHVAVYLREGVYRLAEPLAFGPEDSGTADYSITYAAYPGEAVTISGGVPVTGWVRGASGVMTAPIPATVPGELRELFVRGERRPRARFPDAGFIRIGAVGPDGRTSFTLSGMPPGWVTLNGVELLFLHDWSASRVRIANLDPAASMITTESPIGPPYKHFAMTAFEPHPRFALENGFLFLDAPGEWLADRRTRLLSYLPMAGETPENLQASVPRARQLLIVQGTPERPVRNLHFRGLTWDHAAYPLPPDGYQGIQATFHQEADTQWIPVAPALHFNHAEGCSLTECEVTRLGGSGLWLERQCHSNRISDNVFADISGNGIMVGENTSRTIGGKPWFTVEPEKASRGNVVRNNLVEHCGQQFPGSIGIWVGMAQGTRVDQNEVRDLPYTGISVGWRWDTLATPCRDNEITHNRISRVMQLLSDGGGIYTLGWQPGTVIRDNVIHDIPKSAGKAESNGMFIDQGSKGMRIEFNAIYEVAQTPIRFHMASTNHLVRNLILLNGPAAAPFSFLACQPEQQQYEENLAIPPARQPVVAEILGVMRQGAGRYSVREPTAAP